MSRNNRTYRPRTSEEYNIFHIERGMRKLKKGEITTKEANLNSRFDKLKEQNIGMYEELYPKYIRIVRNMNR